jgi:hypothetical protein
MLLAEHRTCFFPAGYTESTEEAGEMGTTCGDLTTPERQLNSWPNSTILRDEGDHTTTTVPAILPPLYAPEPDRPKHTGTNGLRIKKAKFPEPGRSSASNQIPRGIIVKNRDQTYLL